MSDRVRAPRNPGSLRPDFSSPAPGVRGPRAPVLVPGGFIAGPENRLVQVACTAILKSVPSQFMPVLLYGPTGTGKSLLAQGLAAVWTAEHLNSPALLVTGADFARTFSQAADVAELILLRERFRNASLLVLDDLGPLASKPAAQQELLCTLDALSENGGQVVITSRELPNHMPKLLPTLVSRLLAGLTAPLASPGPEARVQLVRRFAAERKIELSDGVARVLGEGISGFAPELHAAVVELAAHAELNKTAITPALVRKHLAGRAAAVQPSLRDITAVTAKYFQLKVAELRSPSRRRNIVTARGIAIYLARELGGKSLEQVGRHFGGRDHTTVLHSYRSTEERLRSDPAARRAVADLRRLVALT